MLTSQTISIIMPLFNAASFVRRSVKSVLDQDFSNWTLMVADDNSTDSGPAIVQEMAAADHRIVFLPSPLKAPSGAAATRNRALSMAKGTIIAYLDSDDFWDPRFLSSQIAFMNEKKAAFVCGSFYFFTEKGSTLFVPPEKVTYHDILKTNTIQILTVLVNTAEIGLFLMPEEAVKREDFACFLNILKKTKYCYCNPEPLSYYRIHSGSVSHSKFSMIKYQYRVYRRCEKINPIRSFFFLVSWAIQGFKKHSKIK
jgi:teichuronic acid biosynthesis glycosyltransferase TuaG